MNELLSSLDGILFLETATELQEEAEDADFNFIDSMMLDSDDSDFTEEDDEEESPYV